MTNERELLKQALYIINTHVKTSNVQLELKVIDWKNKTQAELEKPEPAPVAWVSAITGDLTLNDMSHTVSWAPLFSSPEQQKPLKEGERAYGLKDIEYPSELFNALIAGNSPYAFYLFQWVPYQTDAKQWRLKMSHDVKTFDGREQYGIWPNGSHCGSFRDDEVEFIRISKNQFGTEWQDPRFTEHKS